MKKMKKTEKIFWMFLGFASIAGGIFASILPLIPAAPFYLFALLCFSKSSKQLHQKLLNSYLYTKYFNSYVTHHALHFSTKIIILMFITITIGVSIYSLRAFPLAIIILAVVWIFNIIYFLLIIKTI